MAQVIYDLAFLKAYTSKISLRKNSQKNHIAGEASSLYVSLHMFLCTMMPFLTYYRKSTKNLECGGGEGEGP
jgi:hypothetical protein